MSGEAVRFGNDVIPAADPSLTWQCPACGSLAPVGEDYLLKPHPGPPDTWATLAFDPPAGAPRCSHGIPKPRYRMCTGTGKVPSPHACLVRDGVRWYTGGQLGYTNERWFRVGYDEMPVVGR